MERPVVGSDIGTSESDNSPPNKCGNNNMPEVACVSSTLVRKIDEQQQPIFTCPPPKDVQHVDQVDWGSIQPKIVHPDPCGCLPSGISTLCCKDESCVLFACQEECGPNCRAGNLCGNKRIRTQQWKKVQVFDAGPKKGRGLRTLEAVRKGDFIIEYVGKAVRKKDLESLFNEYHRERMLYIMRLDGDVYIDARKQGGLARYINHSCQPNCIVDRWKVFGITRAVLFAIQDIAAGEELTFDYKWARKRGRAPTKCYCLAPACRGTLEITISKEESELNVHLEGHWTMPKPGETGEELVNRIVKVFVAGSQEYFVADVINYDSSTDRHLLLYRSDGAEYWEEMGKENWLILDREGEKFVIKRKQLAQPRLSSPYDLNGLFHETSTLKEPIMLVNSQIKQALIETGVLQSCKKELRAHIHASKYSRSSYLAANCNELTDEIKEIFNSSMDGLLWKLTISGQNIATAAERLAKNIEETKQLLEQRQRTIGNALSIDEVETHTLVYPRAIANMLRQKLPQIQAKNKTLEITVLENVSRTVEMLQLKGNSKEDIQNAKFYLWNEMKTMCGACKIPHSGGQEFKQLGFYAGFLNEKSLRKLLSVECNANIDQYLKEAPFFLAVEITLECSIWIQTEDDKIKSSSFLNGKDIFIGCHPGNVEMVWDLIQTRLDNLNQGMLYLNAPEVVGFCQTLLPKSLSEGRTKGVEFLDYVTKVTGVQLSIDQRTTRGWVELSCKCTQADSNAYHQRALFAEKLLYLQIAILQNRFLRQHRWKFGGNWAYKNIDYAQKYDSHNLDTDNINTAKCLSLSEPNIHITLCIEIAELTESASLAPSVAAHAAIILFRYMSKSSRLAEYPYGKPRDVGLACIFIANKCQKETKWKTLDSLIEDTFTHFYPELKFDINSDISLNLESRILAAEQSIIEALSYDVTWEGMNWILRTVLELKKVSEPIAMNAFRVAMTGSILAAGPKVWLNYGPQYVFAALVGLFSVDVFPLISTLGLNPHKLAETAEQIVSVMKQLSKYDGNEGPPKKKRRRSAEELSVGLKALLSAGLPRVLETCSQVMLNDAGQYSYSISSCKENLNNNNLKCIIEGIDKPTMLRLIFPSLKNCVQQIECNVFVDEDTETTCKITLVGGFRSLAVAEHEILELLRLKNVSHEEVIRVPFDSCNEHSSTLDGWLSNSNEGKAVVLKLKDLYFSEASSCSKRFLSCRILGASLHGSGLSWWISSNGESSSGFLQDFIVVQDAIASETEHSRVIQDLADTNGMNNALEGSKQRISTPTSPSLCARLLPSEEHPISVSLKRWPSDKAETKQIKSTRASRMSSGFSPAALQEIQLLHELHAQIGSPCGHPNIMLPVALAVPGTKDDSQTVPDNSEVTTFAPTSESFSYDFMHATPISVFATLPKSVEDVAGQKSYLVFEPTPLVLQQILSRRKSNKNFKKGNDIVTPLLFASWFYDILSGLAHCHSNQTVLKVLKPDQIYLNGCGVAKLGELGGSMVLPFKHVGGSENESILFKIPKHGHKDEEEVLGDPYQAPELLLGSKAYSMESDMWSVGALMATLLLGKPLFSGKDRYSLLMSIFKVVGTPSRSNFSSAKKSPYYDHVKGMMSKSKVYRHEVFKAISRMLDDAELVKEYSGALQLLDKILQLDPKRRISAADALQDRYMRDYAISFRSSHSSPMQYASDWRHLRCKLNPSTSGSSLMNITTPLASEDMVLTGPSKCENVEDLDHDLYGDILA
jgi:serine/threonine protein kinase